MSSSLRPVSLETDQLSSPPSVAPLPAPVAEEPSYLWNTLSWIGSTSSTAFSTIAYGTGHSLRYIGDSIRGDTFVGDLLTTQGLSLAEQLNIVVSLQRVLLLKLKIMREPYLLFVKILGMLCEELVRV